LRLFLIVAAIFSLFHDWSQPGSPNLGREVYGSDFCGSCGSTTAQEIDNGLILRDFSVRSVGGKVMSRGPQSFKQADITKALKAAKKAGFTVQRVEVRNKDGSVLRFEASAGPLDERAGPQDDPGPNEWDGIAK
jgi:hypothetical protein